MENVECSPAQIISLFRQGNYLEALVAVTLWGGMGGVFAQRRVYDGLLLVDIERALARSAQSIRDTNSIEGAWQTLTGAGDRQLGWTAVMASKTLHFLVRALDGTEPFPPVAIDSIMRRFGQEWRAMIPAAERPGDWFGNNLCDYRRYLTAIWTWAQIQQWSTTQVEATIYEANRNP